MVLPQYDMVRIIGNRTAIACGAFPGKLICLKFRCVKFFRNRSRTCQINFRE